MYIKETFLRLTSKTYPHGFESELDELLIEGLKVDEFGNKYIQIGETTCMFTSHLDTATSANTDVTHVIEGNIIKTDGTSILGADDKAGVTIMSYMIKNKIPGLYYFFLGEEVGCVGSRKLSTKLKEFKEEKPYPFNKINKVISFDRRGTTNVITFQSSSRCCSDKFAEALSAELNKQDVTLEYKPDPTGIYTDSAQFTSIYPECTNISVGYRSEHTFTESQDIVHLEKLANACLTTDWENLPIERDPTKFEYSKSYGYWENEWDDYFDGYGYRSSSTYTPVKENDETMHFFDTEFNYVSSIKRKKYTSQIISIDLCDERLAVEEDAIKDLLDSLEVEYESVKWDGRKLLVKHKEPAGNTTECDRDELVDFLPRLDFWKDEIAGGDYELNSFDNNSGIHSDYKSNTIF